MVVWFRDDDSHGIRELTNHKTLYYMKKTIITLSMAALSLPLLAQGLTKTNDSKYAVSAGAPIDAVKWTGGFWGERFDVFSKKSVQSMWETWQSDRSHGFHNFLVASGEKKGKHHGPPFHDGDMYKWMEAVASVYAITKDAELDKIMDRFIGCVVKSQMPNGYIHTPVIIEEMNKRMAQGDNSKDNTVVGTAVGTGADGAFGNKLNFETYNLGHLITSSIVHKRATGKTTFFNCGVKAADFLYDFCMKNPDELAKNAVCPSHYMAAAEMYRETGNKKYLELAQRLIDIRGSVPDGTDDNQDRYPFRDQYNAMGHAVRATYLYSGVADLYMETGEEQLMKNLTSIWDDIVNRKMYINGACGALYDGTSPDGTNYKPDSIQKVHQSFGRPYQLPQSTAHNETCANIGNMLMNWRLFEATGESKYTDLVENCFFNSILCGISLDGTKYFYTNPLRISKDLPYTLRWPKERKEYISCFCCPPNTLRTLCEVQNYAYSIAKDGIYVNLYGANEIKTKIDGIGDILLEQTSDYPWDGNVNITFKKVKKNNGFAMKLRIPAWCENYSLAVNGEKIQNVEVKNGYAVITRNWKQGDVIAFNMEMRTKLVEANPLVEEARGQVAVQRGPIIYCVESQDLNGVSIDDIAIPYDAKFDVVETTIEGSKIMALETEAYNRSEASWKGTLYREVGKNKQKTKIRLVPYYAWGNRGEGEMSVWIQVAL